MSESKRTKYQISDGDDRISDLPQPILHQILVFLPPNGAIKTRLVSKTFLSAFNSFQVIDVERIWYPPGQDEKFINYVNASIQRLKRGRIKLQKLSLRAQLADYKQIIRMKRTISSVIRNRGIEELNIDFGCRRYSLHPRTITSGVSSSIITLKLAGLKLSNLNDLDMISLWPVLENLNISKCAGLKHFKFSNGIIRSIFLESCDGLKSVKIQSPSLQKFSCGWWYDVSFSIISIGIPSKVVDIDISECQHLKTLSFYHVQLTKNWLNNNVPKFVDLQDFELNRTYSRDSNNVISSQSLKRLVWDNIIYGCVIQAPKLQSLKLSAPYYKCMEIDIHHDMHHLRHLSCEKQSGITLDCLKEKLSNMVGFESLELTFDSLWKLKRFEINLPKCSAPPTSIDKTVEVKVHFPNRALLMLHHCVLPEVVINSRERLLDVTLVIDPDMERLPHYNHYLVKLWSWIASFGRVKFLTLACSSLQEKFVMHPQESVSPNDLSVDLLSPIYDLSFLTLKLLSWKDISPELVDDILRQSPNLETLRFVTTGSEERTIEFEYGSRTGEEDDVICCKRLSMKCWRHSLSKVALKNFDDIEMHKLEKCFSEGTSLVNMTAYKSQ